MPKAKVKLTPWARWQIIITLLSPTKKDASRKLHITERTLGAALNNSFKLLGVTTLHHAALKLGIVRVNYDEVGEWVDKEVITLGPGVVIDLEGDCDD
jgi:hypothetical protein